MAKKKHEIRRHLQLKSMKMQNKTKQNKVFFVYRAHQC